MALTIDEVEKMIEYINDPYGNIIGCFASLDAKKVGLLPEHYKIIYMVL